jgi:flavin-dependent dehydrogenase
MAERYDVAILGGGLAGLTAALQLKRARPETSVLLLEKRKGPAPLAAFKVGESTLELSAHYFANVLDLHDHLDAEHVHKPALRYFFTAGDNRDVTRRVEWGPPGSRESRLRSFQIDRGRFENELADRCRALGVDLRDGARVEDVDLAPGDADHTVTFTEDGDEKAASARWVVGATGRASLIRRKLGLEREVDHAINSSWLRLAGGLKIDDWSDDPDWQGRMFDPIRWMCTNHLMGKGYWVWLIPLSSGAISIGIVADPRFHPFERINTLEAALDWLDEHEPVVADAIRSRPDDVEDFLKIEHYSHGTERMFSPDRWGLTGDAGAFLDPFYSPGSDFIAIANGCITDLVLHDLSGEPVEQRAEAYNEIYLEEFHRALETYTRQYEVWGNAEVMTAKVFWDLLLYWGIRALRYVSGVWHDPDFYASVRDDLARAHQLHGRAQKFFRDWHAIDDREFEDVFVLMGSFTTLAERRAELEGPLEPDVVKTRIAENVERMEATAVAMLHKACEQLDGADLDPERPVNPYAIGLDPGRWEEDGLFEEPGLTLEQARERAPGVDNIFVDEVAKVPAFAAGDFAGGGPPFGGPPGGGPPGGGPPGGRPGGPPGGGPPGGGPPGGRPGGPPGGGPPGGRPGPPGGGPPPR